MDTQPQTPNVAGSEARAASTQPESLPGIPAAEAPRPEVAPVVGVTPPPQDPAAAVPSQMSAADVAAAIAAIPGPSGPAQATPMPAPMVADDVDVIEPEWVAKAEEVVASHHGDPYGEEEAVEDLQQDYLQKRYGHTVADPNQDSSRHEGK